MTLIDVNFIAAAWIGGSLLMLPLLALTARFGFVPLVDAIAEARAAGRVSSPADERRVAGIERRLAALASTVDGIAAHGEPFRAAGQPLGRSPHTGAAGGRPAH
jgi:hypothetical protein